MAQQAKRPNRWASALDALSTSTRFFRPKEGRSRIRLYWKENGADDVFFREVQVTFRGNTRTRYLVTGIILATPEGEQPGKEVQPIIIAKTILQAILNYLVEDYDFFDAKEGHGLSIMRTGSGLDSSYQITPSKNAIPLPSDIVLPEKSLDDLAKEYEAWANRPRSGRGKGEEEEEGPAGEKDF